MIFTKNWFGLDVHIRPKVWGGKLASQQDSTPGQIKLLMVGVSMQQEVYGKKISKIAASLKKNPVSKSQTKSPGRHPRIPRHLEPHLRPFHNRPENPAF